MDPINSIPGVTFFVTEVRRNGTTGSVLLHATVDDEDTWNKACGKLEGFRVYTVMQLHETAAVILQKEAEEEKKRLEDENRKLVQENHQLRQRASILEESNRQYILANAEWARAATGSGGSQY